MSPHEREQLQTRFREAIDTAAKAVKPEELRACESRLNHVANGRIPSELRAQVGDIDHVGSALANATNMLRFMQTALTQADWPHELAGVEKTGAFFIFEHCASPSPESGTR